MSRRMRNLVGVGLLGVAAAVVAPLASAAIVTGSWDPALPDPPFDNLGWTTTINLKISDDCSAGPQSLPFIINILGQSFGCLSNPALPSSAFSILSAEIGIYDLTSLRIIDVLRFDPTAFDLFLLDLEGSGAISYLLSFTDSNTVSGSVAGRTSGFDFRLSLPGSAPAIQYRVGSSGGFTTDPTRPTETAFAVNADSDQAAIIAQTRLNVDDRVFNAVPEPGSLALALLALGAAGASGAARRLRRA